MRRSLVLSASAVLSLLFVGFAAQENVRAEGETDGNCVYVNESNFPDAYFRQYVAENLDKDHDGCLTLSEIDSVRVIDVNYTSVENLAGIEYFYALRTLDCSGCDYLNDLDIRNNRALTTLKCYSTNIPSLYIGNDQYLAATYVNGTKKGVGYHVEYSMMIPGINTYGLFAIEPELSVTTSKKDFGICINDIRNFPDDILRSKCHVYDEDNDGFLSDTEVSKITEIDLHLESNIVHKPEDGGITNITGLQIFTNLEKLDLTSNNIKTADLSAFPNLRDLDISFNGLENIDLADNPELDSIRLYGNQLTKLDLSGNPKLRSLIISFNPITEIDLSGNPELLAFYVNYCKLASVDLTCTPKLTELSIKGNKIKSLDLTAVPNLRLLYAYDTPIENIDLRPTAILLDGYLTIEPGSGHSEETSGEILIYRDSADLMIDRYCHIIYCDYKINCDVAPAGAGTVKGTGTYTNGAKVELTATPNEGYVFSHFLNGSEKITSATYSFEASSDVNLTAAFVTVTPKPTVTPTATPTVTPEVKATVTPTPVSAATVTATPAPTSGVSLTPVASVTAVPSVTSSPSDGSKGISGFIDRIYKFVLDREPEAEGAAFWTDELYSFRKTGAEVGLFFITSDELVGRGLSDSDYVTVLYNTFFGRSPEEEGFKFWTSALATGTLDRASVASGFVYSQEWADTCASYGIRSGVDVKPSVEIEPSAATLAFVERMYTTAMDRASDPSGLEFWSSELANFRYTGEQVGVMFFLSDEMQGFGLSDSEFVTRLYKTFMDRSPEEGGFEFWVKYLGDGGSRSDVVYGFTRSEEFMNKCIEARILPY